MTNIDVLITDDKRVRLLLCHKDPVLVQKHIIRKLQYSCQDLMFISKKCHSLLFPKLYTVKSICHCCFNTVSFLYSLVLPFIMSKSQERKGDFWTIFYAIMIILFSIKTCLDLFLLNSLSFNKMFEFAKCHNVVKYVHDIN